jgi:hypothetical protein
MVEVMQVDGMLCDVSTVHVHHGRRQKSLRVEEKKRKDDWTLEETRNRRTFTDACTSHVKNSQSRYDLLSSSPHAIQMDIKDACAAFRIAEGAIQHLLPGRLLGDWFHF